MAFWTPRPRLVTFDLDDTLVDTFATLQARVGDALAAAQAVLGVALTEDHRERLLAEVERSHDDRFAPVLGVLGIDRTDPAAPEIEAAYGARTLALLKPVDGARETLEVLSRWCTVAVITNGDGPLQRRKLQVTGLAAHVTRVFASSELGLRKPDREIFELACASFGMRPAEAVHVGDSPAADALGAGMRAVLLATRVPHPAASGLDGVVRIHRLTDLHALA